MNRKVALVAIIALISNILIGGCLQTEKAQLNANNFNLALIIEHCSADGLAANPHPGIELLLPEAQLFDDIVCTLEIDGESIPISEISRTLPKAERIPGEPTTEEISSINQRGIYYLSHNKVVSADKEHQFTVCCNGVCDTETVNLSKPCWYQRTHSES